jgi:antitoxin (DNA-binding transcriptional repressor) of toxin-antitoxin stability system
MKTLSISEAVRDLGKLLKQAIAGEEIGIQSDNTIVALRPLPSDETPATASPSPREALRQLQAQAHLSAHDAESYLQEVRAERLAAEKHTA